VLGRGTPGAPEKKGKRRLNIVSSWHAFDSQGERGLGGERFWSEGGSVEVNDDPGGGDEEARGILYRRWFRGAWWSL